MLDVDMATSGRILPNYCQAGLTTPSKIIGTRPSSARYASRIIPNANSVLSSGPSPKSYHSPRPKNPSSTTPLSCSNPVGSDTRAAISCWSCLSSKRKVRFPNPHRSCRASMIRSTAMISITSPRDLLIRPFIIFCSSARERRSKRL